MRRAILLVMVVMCAAAGAWAQSTPKESLLALAKRDRTMAIVDPATLKVIVRLPCGPDPHEVIASADGKLAFVSNYGGGEYNTISVIDLETQKPLAAIDLGVLHGPHGLAFAGGKLYFTAESNKVIGTYDPATQKVDWILGTGQNRTHMVDVSKDLATIFTSNVSSGTMSIIERVPAPGGPGRGMRVDWNETVVPVGHGSEGFDVAPDGKELWVANAGDGTISIINVAEKKVVQTLEVNAKGANRLKFTRDGKRVFVASLRDGNVTVIDASSRGVLKRINIGRGAAGILMQPDGTRAFVAASPDNSIAVIDLRTLEITGRIDVGNEPDGMAWAARE